MLKQFVQQRPCPSNIEDLFSLYWKIVDVGSTTEIEYPEFFCLQNLIPYDLGNFNNSASVFEDINSNIPAQIYIIKDGKNSD